MQHTQVYTSAPGSTAPSPLGSALSPGPGWPNHTDGRPYRQVSNLYELLTTGGVVQHHDTSWCQPLANNKEAALAFVVTTVVMAVVGHAWALALQLQGCSPVPTWGQTPDHSTYTLWPCNIQCCQPRPEANARGNKQSTGLQELLAAWGEPGCTTQTLQGLSQAATLSC